MFMNLISVWTMQRSIFLVTIFVCLSPSYSLFVSLPYRHFSSRQITFPVYGNHCGPGHGSPLEPAIDEVDAICKEHDICYIGWSLFDGQLCTCDIQFVAMLSNLLPRLNDSMKDEATILINIFTILPCVAPVDKNICIDWNIWQISCNETELVCEMDTFAP